MSNTSANQPSSPSSRALVRWIESREAAIRMLASSPTADASLKSECKGRLLELDLARSRLVPDLARRGL